MTDEYHFSRIDHDMLVELTEVTAELREIAKPPLYRKVQFWASLAAAMTFNLGLVLVLGGPRRVSVSAYSIIAHYGGHLVWGSAFLAASMFTALCAWRFHRLLRWALIVQALPFVAIALSFGIAAVRYPDANLTAAPMYTWVMIMHACLADYARKEF